MNAARWAMLVGFLALGAAVTAPAAPPVVKPKIDVGAAVQALTGEGDEAARLAANLRALMLKAMPDPLFEDAKHWGKQKKGPRGKMRNNGRWYKVKMTGRNLPTTLLVDIRDIKKPKKGQTLFLVHTTFDANILLERQTWKLGVRLYSGSTRARLGESIASALTVRLRISSRLVCTTSQT